MALAVALHAVQMMPNHDNGWLLIAAERLLAGGTYRHDFVEPNPPLIIFLNVPAILLARLLGIATYTAFSLYVGGLILLSALLACRFLTVLLKPEGGLTGPVLIGYVAILALEPGYEFGQREHLFTVLFVPGLLWFALRETGEEGRLDTATLLAIGLASVAVLIKPFYLVLAAALFGLRLFRLRSWRTILDPAAAMLVAAGLLYAATILLAYPEYLEEARMQGQVYFAWDRDWRTVLLASKDAVGALCLALALAALAPVPARVRTVLLHLALVAAGLLAVALLQKKGWTYHLLPVVEISLIALLLLAAILLPRLAAPPRLPALVALAAILLETAFLALRPASEVTYAARAHFRDTPLIATLQRLAAGQSYLMLTGGYLWGVPGLIDATLGARGLGQVFLPGAAQLAAGNADSRARAAALYPFVVQELVGDLERFRPAIVAVDRRQHRQGLPESFDILRYYGDAESFRRAWASYRLVESQGGWDFYRRID
ncbi:hypothetical protein [Roseomonas sp. BN140053]|uniref:hypothetical protein n=1 Tax=Roseomonas sp. BN140053 TaxID=3391898 RepID=UPI0039EB91BA